jgi:hypothetical protein
MADANDSHDPDFIRYFVDDAVVSDTDPPVVFRANEFTATGWTRLVGEITHGGCQLRALLGGDLL